VKRLAFLLFVLVAGIASAQPYDVVLAGGRAMDPETGLDAVRHVGIRDGRVAAISEEPLRGDFVLDVSGLVVAPGFIDLHAHGQDPTSNAFQARDGVTTALDLELGAWPVAEFYAQREGEARIHTGVSVGHIPARVKVMDGVSPVHPPTTPSRASGLRGLFLRVVQRFWRPTAYQDEAATPEQVEEIVALVAQGLDAGGLGIGFGLAYTPGAEAEEIRRLFALAALRDVPCFVHLRAITGPGDLTPIDSVIAHAEATGASLHVVHVTSTGLADTPEFLARIESARARGLDVSTEVYPYTAASTRIESALFEPEVLLARGVGYEDLQWSETGERLTEESFERYREQGGWVIIHMMTPEIVDPAVAHPLTIIASDGIPFLKGGEHPRGAGTFARVLGRYVREKRALSLREALRKMTLLPARRLESFAPAMARKGRLQVGADADLVVFDPERVVDRATFEDSYQASEGISEVLVGGTFVVRDGQLVEGVFPGQAIRAGAGGAP